MTNFRVELVNYNGPLDVLVETVKRGELPILELMLSDIAVGYLTQMRGGPPDLEEAGEFLVLMTILLELKSRAILPNPKPSRSSRAASTGGEPAVRRQLLKAQAERIRFDRAVEFLAERASRRRASLRRIAADLDDGAEPAESTVLRELEVWDLVTILGRLLRQGAEVGARQIARDPTPIGVYQDRLEAKILQYGRASLPSLFAAEDSKSQRIGKFLALLELVKRQRVWVEWDATVGDLVFTPPRPQATNKPAATAEPDAAPLSDRYLSGVRQPEAAIEPEVWPDLPEVVDFSRRKAAWAGYKPIIRIDRPPPAAAG